MTHPSRLIALAASLALLPAVLAGCGGDNASTAGSTGTTAGGTPEEVSLVLDWFPNADHAGIAVAQEKGLDAKAGAEISTSVPSDPTTTLTAIAAGKKDLGITYAPELLIARAKGVPVKAVGAIAQVPLNSIIARSDRGITRPRDLEGKVVGIAGVPSDRALLDTVVKADGGDPAKVQTKVVGYSLAPSLAAGKVDAVIGAYWNIEGADLRRKGVPITVMRIDEYGVPRYDELVVVASEDAIRDRPAAIRAALAGIAAGTDAAAADAGAAVAALEKANPDIAKQVLPAQVKDTLPALRPDGGAALRMDAAQWDALAAWMAEKGLVKGEVSGSGAIDTSLLPEASQ
ncbi:MAG: ABC transporter substrate-binding protein [Acidobacteria bacterium]|nr:ABC transporter substrate-binding protein [Acidobacteriota bacterium]